MKATTTCGHPNRLRKLLLSIAGCYKCVHIEFIWLIINTLILKGTRPKKVRKWCKTTVIFVHFEAPTRLRSDTINYSKCLFWLRCRLCFSLLRSAVMYLNGHRSSVGRPSTTNIDLAYSEGCLEPGGLV